MVGMDRIDNLAGRGIRGGDPASPLSCRPVQLGRGLFLLAALGVTVSFPGASAAEVMLEGNPRLNEARLFGLGESLRLESATTGGGEASRFSQIDDPAPSLAARFALAVPSVADAGVVVPPLSDALTTTAQFDGPFEATRSRLIAAIENAAEADRTARRLDYAQFLISRMMLPEARGIVTPIAAGAGTIPPAERERAEGYARIVARLLAGTPSELPPSWAGDPLWPLALRAEPAPDTALRNALSSLSRQSRAVATAVLPLLFDKALAGGNVATAAEILSVAPAGTALEGTPRLALMRGRLALAQGAEDMAFEAFARLAEGSDQAAAEARIAMADMALARKDRNLLPQVRQILQDGMPRWRGDDTALRLRVRLARVAEDMGDIPAALEVMSAIRHEHPDTPEADLAEARIAVMVGRLAGRIADPAMPIATAIEAVRRLDAAFAQRGDWVAVRAGLAERLERAGLTEAARAEYAAILQSPFDALQAADPSVMDRVTVRQAALLLRAGQETAALSVLDRRTYPRGPEEMDRHTALRLAAGRTAMLPGLLLTALSVTDAADIPAPEVQLALAKVATQTGQEKAALAAYDRALPAASGADRLTAARLAGVAESPDLSRRFAEALEGDRAPLQRAVAQNLSAPRLSGQRLSVSSASRLIDAALQAETAVQALLAEGPAP